MIIKKEEDRSSEMIPNEMAEPKVGVNKSGNLHQVLNFFIFY